MPGTEPGNTAGAASQGGSGASRRLRVLVINDTQDILEAFRDILEDEGYEAILYAFAITDIHVIEQVNPDLIILDYVFGLEKLGWQTLQLLKMHRSTAAIPVIVCTAATSSVREIEGYLTAHDIQLVAKPFDIDYLLNAVRQALKNANHSANLLLESERQSKGGVGGGGEHEGSEKGGGA